MEVESTQVKESSKHLPPLPAEFWKILQTSILELFNNGENIVQKLGIIIKTCKNHHEYYVPPKLGQQMEYEAKLPHYIGFTTWLLGQIVRATTIEQFECYHQQFVDWQMIIIELLAYQNQYMFSVIMMEYLAVIKDLVAARNLMEGPLVFEWFRRASQLHIDSQPPLDKFNLEDDSRCASVIIHLLKVVRSQTGMLSKCSPQATEDYWRALLALLGDSDMQVFLAALDSTTANIECAGFPHQTYMFHNLCESLGAKMTLISNSLSGNCDGKEAVKPILVSFCAFFRAVLSNLETADKKALCRLYITLVSFIVTKNPFLYSGITSRDYCKLLVSLSKECTVSVNIQTKIPPILDHASNFPAILLIVESLIRNDLQMSMSSSPESTRMCEEMSGLWRSIVAVASQTLDTLQSSGQTPDTQRRLARFLTAISRTAANISLSFDSQTSASLVFFGDTFYHNWNKLLREIELDLIYHEVTTATKYMMTLKDILMINVHDAHSLMVFMSVPWLKNMVSAQLPEVNIIPYQEMSRLNICVDDALVKRECVEGLTNMGVCGSFGLDWRLSVLSQARSDPDSAANVLQLLPIMLTTLPTETRRAVVTTLLEPYFASLDISLTIKLSQILPSIICGLACTTELARNSKGDLCTCCKVCDNSDGDSMFVKGDLERTAVTLLGRFIELRRSENPEVRKNVALSLKCWSKHLPQEILKEHLEKWLRFIKDNDYDVRMAMAQTAAHLVSPDSSCKFLAIYRQLMLVLTQQSLSTADRDLQLSIMTTVYNIGCQPIDNVLLTTLELFVVFVSHPLAMHNLSALVYLKKIAAARAKTVQELFFRFQDEIFKYVSLLMVSNYLSGDKNVTAIQEMLAKLAQGFQFHNTKELWDLSACKYLLKYLFPLIVKFPEAGKILFVVAATAGSDVPAILKTSFPYVYSHVFLFEDRVILENVCQLIEGYTELPMERLICYSFKVVICELLLYFHMEKAKVTEGLRELRERESEKGFSEQRILFSSGSASSPNTDITQFLQPRFLAVLAYLDSILVSQSYCESTKRHALLTLPELIKLMGVAHITPVRFKVLATLRYALDLYHSYFPELICSAWRAFVQNVSSLGPLLSTIFVSLLPLLDQYPVEISSVFRILVLDNLEAVRGHLAELYFLPDTPATHQIYSQVQQELANLRTLPVKDQLAVTLRLATHENSDVRLRGLHKLRADLSLHRKEVVPLIVAHDNLDPFILKLFEALLSGCQDTDADVRLASAQCLGELGALDPGRVLNKFKIQVEEKEIFVINSEDFVIRALNEFVRAFQAASHTTTMDVFAFGIQELLKIYNVPSSGVWNKLSDSTKEIISPFRESRYMPYTDISDNQSQIPHPIFGTIHGSSLKIWAKNWVCRLIPSVTDEFVRRVFSACLLGLKKDLQSLLFFLPYIVLHAILGATKSQSKRIGEEMSALLFSRGDDQTPSGSGDTPRSLPTSSSVQGSQASVEETHTQSLCAKTVYQLLDFLYHWLRHTKENIRPDEESAQSAQYNTLKEFLKTFSKKEIADGSFSCKEYTRALLFLEEYMTENPDSVQTYLPYLGKIYYHLHDPDSFRGVVAIREGEPTAQEMILYHQLTGKLQDAAACYERLDQERMPSEEFYKGMVQCYLGMDQPSTALRVAQGFLNSMDKWQQCGDLADEQAEAMLALSMFPQLEQVLTTRRGCGGGSDGEGWGAALGHALLHLSKQREREMVAGLDHIRRTLVRNLAGCSLSRSGYRHGYDVMVKLHILTELEKVGQMVFKMQGSPLQDKEFMFKKVVHELDERLKVIQPSYRVLQPVLCVRRVVLSLAQQICPNIHPLFTAEIGNSWLKSIEIARKSGHFQQAYTNILTVEPFKPKGLFLEKAKLLWARSEPDAALNTLQRGVERNFCDTNELKKLSESMAVEDRRLCAEAKLLIAMYNDANVNIDVEANLLNYKSAVEACPGWEKSWVCLAQCQYKYLRTFSDNPQFLSKTLDYQTHVINGFGKSLQFGCEYIYQSMPRMLSIWLDFGTQLAQDSISGRNTDTLAERRTTMDKMTSLIETYSKRLPTYMFMTAFSQLISRICHPQKDCYKILKAIIIKIIIAYPQQALWMFLSVYKSPYTVRVKRCEEVLRSNEISKEKELCRTISDFRELFDRLIELGNKRSDSKGTAKVNVKSYLRSLYTLVSKPGFGRVVIPLQRFRTISLPRSTAEYHNPFPEDIVYISGMKEEIVVLASLQKPKKFTFIGTDGKQYPMMCKPDDLRLDSRMMEFNSIVNMYLQRDAEARDRGLYIRTYSAVPLNDTTGLIEWVPNLIGLRQVINGAYKQMGILMAVKEYRENTCAKNDPLSKKREVFLKKLLPRHPPVLREWYLREFSHPTAWYLARSSYVRTLAVMSIVGYMLGLGDRHGENILLDATCGDVVHVDFNCLFNRGERFDCPERVPFRLTHNLVHAMGPTGVEGVFRHSCEITIRVMRQQIDQLMSVVRPFCYDPLVTWNTDKNTRDENAEMTNEKAMEDIQNIESRLQGIMKTRNGTQSVPLSVEGQVGNLIIEATAINNLCQMYIGWGPYL